MGGCSTKESGGCSISHVPHFIFLKDIKFLSLHPWSHDIKRKSPHKKKSYIFFGWLSDSRFSKTFPFHFPWFLWLTALWFPPWRVGFTMSQVLWSKALAHSAAFSKVGTWKTDWFSGWKPWKDAKGSIVFFAFVNYAFLLSLCSVSFKEDVSGKMSDETWNECQNSYPTCLFWIASGRKKKANSCYQLTLLWSNISYPGSRLGGGGHSTPIYFQWPGGRFSSRRPLIFQNVGWTFSNSWSHWKGRFAWEGLPGVFGEANWDFALAFFMVFL